MLKGNVLRILIVSVLFLLTGNIFPSKAALPEQYQFSLLDMNNGLSNNLVKCFLKDSRGFLWIGTGVGLNRYDGYELKVFKYDSKDTSSLVGNGINNLFEDPEGNIWVQTNYGFSIYNPKTEKFYTNRKLFLEKYDLPGYDIENIVKDIEGNFWFINTGLGVTKYNPADKTSVTLRHSSSDENSISTNYVSAVSSDSKGDIWLVHRNGILEKIDKETLEIVERNEQIAEKFSQELLFYGLTIDSEDDVWVYLPYDSRGIFFYERNKKKLFHYHKNSKLLQLNNNLARGLVEATDGKIWVGVDHGGINIIDKETLTVNYVLHNDEVKKSLAHNSINTLYKDDEGIIWVGTVKNGVNYFHENIIRFPHYKNQPSIEESLPYDDVNAFVEDDKGNLWIGTNGGGLLYFDRKTGQYERYVHDSENKNSLSSDVIVTLLIDSKNVLWIGTYMGGLNKFDGKSFTHYKHDPKNPGSLSDDSIWEIYEDSKGNLWLGTLSSGMELFDAENEIFYHFKEGNKKIPIHCNYITAITEDQHGNLWIGGGFGVDVINVPTGEAVYYGHDARNPNSLISNNVLCIYKDSHDNIWVGTSEGLNLYNEKDRNFRHYTKEDGLPNNSVISILEDDNSNLWLSTSNGLSNLIIDRGENADIKSIFFRNYDELDGLQGKAFNDNAARKLNSGELVFGGANGFNLFLPDNLRRNETAPRVVLTDFQLFNKSLKAGDEVNGRIILPKAISDASEVVLKHNENVFSIEFAALNFLHPEKNRYKYMLEGFDKEWLTADKNTRRVTYTNLDPGNYEFKVIASNNDGVWNNEGASIRMTVLAPVWKTTEAYFLYTIFILSALFFIRRAMIQRERMNFQIEQERRDARKMHELDLMKIKFFTNVSHEFRTPLSLIITPIEKLVQNNQDAEKGKQLQTIHRNARRLLNLVNQLLDFRKLEVEGIQLHLSEGNVIKFVEEAVKSFSDLSEKKSIGLAFESNMQELQASFDMDKLEKILFNLLSNAFKFTPENGQIDVQVNCYDNDSASEGIKLLEIKVKDTGIGISKEKLPKVFDRFFRNEMPGNMVNQGSGIGLSITKEFAKIHGGSIHAESEVGKGSCFTVVIPVREVTALELRALDKVEQGDLKVRQDGDNNTTPEKLKPGKEAVVLLVEDNDDFRFYLKDNLGVHFSILEAKDGNEGWQKALANMPDLIVSDLMMPELDGIELCKKIKTDPRTSHIPLVLLTANSADEQKLKGLKIGANDYITKPFNFELLLTRLENLIAQRQSLQKILEKKISVQTSEIEIVSMDDKLIQKAIKIVEENLSNADFTVEDLSKEIGMSRVHLYKKMVSLTGKSPVEFIRNIRLQRAAQFLAKSQLSVAEVAYKVGFNNRKYFTKYFKNEYKVLPSLYAENKQK